MRFISKITTKYQKIVVKYKKYDIIFVWIRTKSNSTYSFCPRE